MGSGAEPYELPVGTSGYLVTEARSEQSSLKAGYVVGDHFVSIEIPGFRSEEFDSSAIPQDVLVGTLVSVLTAMNG